MTKSIQDMTLQEFETYVATLPEEDFNETLPSVSLGKLKEIIIEKVKHMSEVDQIIKHLVDTDKIIIKEDGTVRLHEDVYMDYMLDNVLLPQLKEYNDKNPDPVITEGIRQAMEYSRS